MKYIYFSLHSMKLKPYSTKNLNILYMLYMSSLETELDTTYSGGGVEAVRPK